MNKLKSIKSALSFAFALQEAKNKGKGKKNRFEFI
jgi:hypothetical protein